MMLRWLQDLHDSSGDQNSEHTQPKDMGNQ